MSNNPNRSRINFYATERIQDIVKKYTEDLGMTQGAFISMCIAEYAKNDEMLQNMNTLKQTIEDLQKLKESAE